MMATTTYVLLHAAAVYAAAPFLVELNSAPGLSCAVTSSAADGHIESENGAYSNGARTCWLIRPDPPASTITLSFRDFTTEQYYDTLHIFDGQFFVQGVPPCTGKGGDTGCRLSPAAGLSGKISPAPLVAHSGTVLLIFESDFDVRSRGFTFAWTSSDAASLSSGYCAPRCTHRMTGNGECEQECYNGACEWDKHDCDGVCDMATGCTDREAHDNTCDARCLNAGCEFDAADCSCER